jgi:transposase
MATGFMPEEFFEVIRPLLPADKPVGVKGGRPRILNRVALRVIWYVLTTGIRWQDVLLEMGCSGRTAHRRLEEWQVAGIWDALHKKLLELLNRDGKLAAEIVIVDSTQVPAPGGGEATGPNPTDRGKTGTKHTLMVDANGVPLALHTTGSNVSDQTQMVPIVLEFPRVKGKVGRPKEHPDEAYADRGYDNEATRLLLRWLGIEPKIAKRRTEHGSGLGRVRWVVERTNAWLKGLRRMRIRWDRLLNIQDAWNSLAMSVICFRLWCECPG